MLPSHHHADERSQDLDHRRSNAPWRLLKAILLLLAVAAILPAQQGSQISGVVQDSGGLTVPDALITVIQRDTGLTRSAQSKADGSYILPNLPTGPYRMTITKAGFNSYVQEGIVLQVDSNPVLDATLTVGAVSQEVVVKADASMVETHSTGIGQVVDQQRVVELPLNGRNPTQLIFIAGAATAGDPNLTTNKNYPTISISVAGGPANSVSYILDGATHNDPENNLNQPLPFPDALQEFKVETSALPAQYGFLGAATVNVITKTGGNEFHGDAFEFLRNGDMNARNAYAVTRDSLKRNQFGGVVGGPVQKNKLFFFAGYQGTIQRSDPATGIAFVPTPAMLTGDFTAIASPACNSNRQVTLKAPFVNNMISPTLFSVPALNLVKKLPQPLDQCGTVRFGTVSNSEEHLGLGRVDYQINTKNTLFFRYYIAHLDQLSPYNNNNPLTLTAPFVTYNMQFFAMGETYVFNPTTVSSFHASVDRGAIVRGSPPFFTAADLGVNMVSLDPAFSMISVSGAFTSGGGGTNAGHVYTTTPQITEDISLIRGNHQIALGVNWMNRIQNILIDLYGEGAFSFSSQVTNLAMGDFLTGNVGTFIQGNPAYNYNRQQYIGIYAQDSWKIRPRFQLNYGIRWEPLSPTKVKDDLVSHFDLNAFTANAHSSTYPGAPAGLTYPGDPGFPDKSGYFGKNNVFAPRIGMVWDPKGDGRLTMRASYGIFYNRPQLLFDYQYGFAPPWGIQITLTNPAGGFANPWAGYAGGNPFPPNPSKGAFFPPAAGFINMPLNPNPPSIQQWNWTVQKQVGTNWLLSASYLGNVLRHLWTSSQVNPGLFLPGATLGNLQQRRYLSVLNPTQGALISTMLQLDDGGTGSYNGLLVSAQKRMAGGTTLLANYTWSHCISDPPATNLGTGPAYTIPWNRRADRGPCSPGDIRHNFNLSAVAQSPKFSQRLLAVVAGNWQASTILSIRSGAPLNVTTGADNALSGQSNERPNLIGDPIPANQNFSRWLNPAAFGTPAAGTYGNLGIYAVRAPGYLGLDGALVRMFPVTERVKVQFRAEAFNILNHVNANSPVITVSSGNFGQVTSAQDPRILQLALKVVF